MMVAVATERADMVSKKVAMSKCSCKRRSSSSCRWKFFKYRRRRMLLPKFEGFKLLFLALPRFLKFLIRTTLSSVITRSKHSLRVLLQQGQPITPKEDIKQSASNRDRAISIELQAFSKSGENVTPSSLRELDPHELTRLKLLAKEGSEDKVLLLPNNEGVNGADLLAIVTDQWLNSDIVNTYFSLLKLRYDRLKSGPSSRSGNTKLQQAFSDHQKGRSSYLNGYFFTSFWYTKYTKSGYLGVLRWTRGVDLRMYDCLFFPVNLHNSHWVLVVVYISSGVIEYYDALSSTSFRSVTAISSMLWLMKLMVHALLLESKKLEDCVPFYYVGDMVSNYLNEEALRNNWSSSDLKQWKPMDVSHEIPRQVDTNNCGVYMCIFADLLSRGARPPFAFSHKDMYPIRLGMAADLVRGFINAV